ncbi:DUF222 domain-containing protein [Blastococcus colisei]|nr:DUF222 domain-containing protein [Blastococcus colisei]
MFGAAQASVEDRPSVFESLLRAALADAPGLIQSFAPRSTLLIELPSHRTTPAATRLESGTVPDTDPDDVAVAEPEAVEEAEPDAVVVTTGTVAGSGPEAVTDCEPESGAVEPELAAFAGLLEVGAGHLARAKAAHRVQWREAAVQVRALAAFAAARPAAALDRPDDEVGAAAAASRAARPAMLTQVSEWAVDEVMVALGLSSQAATVLLTDSVTLVEQLPATVAALEAGTISWTHARMLIQVLAPLSDDGVRAEVEAGLLAGAAGRTVGQLRASAQRAVLRVDATAATRRLATAIGQRAVRGYAGEDGMGTLAASMPLPVLRACESALHQYAEACTFPRDERTLDQRKLDCLVDLILRPNDPDRPPVQAHLDIVASVGTLTGGDEPGEVDGQPVPAALIRELAYALSLLPRPASTQSPNAEIPAEGEAEDDQGSNGEGHNHEGHNDGAGDEAGDDVGDHDGRGDGIPAGEPAAVAAGTDRAAPEAAEPVSTEPEPAESKPATFERTEPQPTEPEPGFPDPARAQSTDGRQAVAADLASAWLGDLLNLRSTAGTALAGLPQIAIIDELSGQLLALASAAETRRAATCTRRACRTGRTPCTHPPAGLGLGPPPESPGYQPSDSLQRFVRARDRRCRFPGCRARADRCDLDHNTPYPAGATSCDNLCCLCRHHHRLSHQAPGWTMHRLPDGGIEWTTPSGDRITTHPPRYGNDDPAPPKPPKPPERPPPLSLRELVLGRSATAEERTNDPAPF